MDSINKFYNEMEFLFKEVAWDKLFQKASLGEEFTEFVSAHPEMFWEEPDVKHAGLLHWICEGKRYVSVARVDATFGEVEMMVVPRWENNFYWDWDHGGENIFVWHVPEMTVQEIEREHADHWMFVE